MMDMTEGSLATSVDIVGVGMSMFRSYGEAVELAIKRVRERQKTFCVAINPEKVLRAWSDHELRSLLNAAEMRICDGVGTAIAARILHGKRVARVTGVQLFMHLIEAAAENGLGVYLLGASTESNEAVARALQSRHSGLRIVGARDGYFDDDADVIRGINAAAPDMLFVAMGSPKQEQWIQKHRSEIDASFCMGVGGSFDVVSGRTRWAPKIFRQTGTEFLYRLVCEPSRWRRQIRLPLFLLRVIHHSLVHGSSPRASGSDLVFLRDTVIKRMAGAAAHDEFLITQAAHELGTRCGLFYVPRVLRHVPESGAIELERISGLTPLSRVARRELERDVIARAGAALAHVHRHLRAPETVESRAVLDWPCREQDQVVLHGDFNTTNVCRDLQGRLVIIDWSSAPALGARRLYGSRYFDIAHFLVTLAAHRRNVFEGVRRFPVQSSIFLRAYAAECGVDIDLAQVRSYVLRVSALLRDRPAPSVRIYAAYYRMRRSLVHRALATSTSQWGAKHQQPHEAGSLLSLEP